MTEINDFEKIKKIIEEAHVYNKENNQRFHEFRRYVYKSTLSSKQKTTLRGMSNPILEFNILMSYIDTLIGEFIKHEPSVNAKPQEGARIQTEMLNLVCGHLRYIIYEANKKDFAYKVYQDLLSGGFSVIRVYTDYINNYSFKQMIGWERVFDPTLTFFDPMARERCKADGNFCGEIYPMTEEDFKLNFPGVDLKDIKYKVRFNTSGELEGFQWSYKNARQQKFILVCDFYEKIKKRVKIVELADGQVMELKKYNQIAKKWKEDEMIPQLPIVVYTRSTIKEIIVRKKICEAGIISEEQTDFNYFPLIYVDGNGIDLAEESGDRTTHHTVPFVYSAKGMQDLKNFSGISLANHFQKMIASKYIVKKEALPQEDDYIKNLKNTQIASLLVVNAFKDNDPNQPIPDPIREVVNAPAPPEILQTFSVADNTIQTILGGFASNLGMQGNKLLSGKAVIESAAANNSTAMPYVIGYLAGITQAACLSVDLFPKYLLGDRQIPIINDKSEEDYIQVKNGFKYGEKSIKVQIEPGVNFNTQKTQALEQIGMLMQSSQKFSEFMNSEQGLSILLQNLTIYGSDQLQQAVPKWFEEQKQQQQQEMEMQHQMMQNSPQMIKAMTEQMKAQSDAQAAQMKMQIEQQQQQFNEFIEIAKLSLQKQRADDESLMVEHTVSLEEEKLVSERNREETSIFTHELDAAAKMADIQYKEHENIRKNAELVHKITKEGNYKNEQEIQTE